MTSALVLSLILTGSPAPKATDYFTIAVVDAATGRGVPLVELRTVNEVRYWTDSNGLIAFYEPGLMNQTVFVHVSSHGYEYPKDGFGIRGKALKVTPGGKALLKIKRVNIAERLYRITGAGIYRDSVLVAAKVPLRQPVLNAQVFGSDSALSVFFHGKLYWFWGDTNRPSYPLGNYFTPGATSLLPGKGGLDPDAGVDLHYFIGTDGFAKPTAQLPGKGPAWINGLVVVRDRAGQERLFTQYARITPPLTTHERGLAEFDDARKEFVKKIALDLKNPLYPHGHPFHHTEDGVEYVYFGNPFPYVRVPATAEALLDVAKYQAYTCLRNGSTEEQPQLDRDEAGRLRFVWRTGVPPLTIKVQEQLLKDGRLKKAEQLYHLRDVETGKPVRVHSGSVCWNDYRRRWVMIAVELYGATSLLGEVWLAEADTPVGPWTYARRIVSHHKYSFYNPKQHQLFDKDRGKVIFFEGTYTTLFSGNTDPTPRYDYNQLMYKLDLTDKRLALPVPFYRVDVGGRSDLVSRGGAGKSPPGQLPKMALAFYAAEDALPGTVPVFVVQTPTGVVLKIDRGKKDEPATRRFYALPATLKKVPPNTVPLYEFVHPDGRCWYGTEAQPAPAGFRRQEQPICRVWQA